MTDIGRTCMHHLSSHDIACQHYLEFEAIIGDRNVTVGHQIDMTTCKLQVTKCLGIDHHVLNLKS